MMSNLSERDRRTLTMGGVGVGVILFVVLVLFPVMNYYTKLDKAEKAAVQKISDIQNYAFDTVSAGEASKALSARATLAPSKEALNQQTPRMLLQMQKIPGY